MKGRSLNLLAESGPALAKNLTEEKAHRFSVFPHANSLRSLSANEYQLRPVTA
jgi:hypothetical protein